MQFRGVPSGPVLRLREGSNVFGRGPYTGVFDERVSRAQLSAYVTLAGTVVVTCIGRNPVLVRPSAAAAQTLLQVI